MISPQKARVHRSALAPRSGLASTTYAPKSNLRQGGFARRHLAWLAENPANSPQGSMLAFKRACTNMGIVKHLANVDSGAIRHIHQQEAGRSMVKVNRHTSLLEMPVSDRKQRAGRF